MSENSPEQIVTLRIDLVETDPLIWREVEVPTAITLKALHDVVQAAMGWFDQHLWELRQGPQRYGEPIPGDDWGGPATLRAEKVRLSEILTCGKTVLEYTYDFGDSWEHRLVFTNVRVGEPGTAYPRYLAGERTAPPEDSGGLPGFYYALDVLADPSHPDYQDIAEWYDGYDPDDFDDLPLKFAVGRIASRRRAGTVRKAKPGPA